MHRNIRHGFVYERVPHITLTSIASTAEIDVIWDQWQLRLEPLREKLNAALKAEINEDAWATLNSGISRAFAKPKSERIAAKVINHLGEEVMNVFRVW